MARVHGDRGAKGVADRLGAEFDAGAGGWLGTIDMTVGGLVGSAKCIPIQPTMAQTKTNSVHRIAAWDVAKRECGGPGVTGNGGAPVITLKNAAMESHSLMFGLEALRAGEMNWNTTRGFTAGVAQAVGVVA
jgi:hypothetical protein